MVLYAGGVFFRVFYHSLHSFLHCDRLNTMAQRAIIPDSSIIASNFSKWEGKGPHRTLIFSITSLVKHLMVSKKSPVYVFLRFPHTLISKIVYLHHSNFRILLLCVVLIVRMEIINYVLLCGGQTIKYGLIPGHPDIKNPWYWKGLRFCVFRQLFRDGGFWLAAFRKSRKRRSWLDICLLCVEMRYQCGFMNTHLRTQT